MVLLRPPSSSGWKATKVAELRPVDFLKDVRRI